VGSAAWKKGNVEREQAGTNIRKQNKKERKI
jgi:hypothetical protein